MGVIRASHNVLEMKRVHYLDWLDSRVREVRLDGADIIELNFEPALPDRIEACEAIAQAIMREAFRINTLPFCVRSSSPKILNAAIRFGVAMVCTTASCLTQCPDFSTTDNKNLNVVLPTLTETDARALRKKRLHKEPTSESSSDRRATAIDLGEKRLPEIFELVVADFQLQRTQLIDLGVQPTQIGLALDDGFASTDSDYRTLLPSREQLADFPFPMLLNLNPIGLRMDAVGSAEATTETRIAIASSLTAIASFLGIGCVRTEFPKDLSVVINMLEMLRRSNNSSQGESKSQ